MTENEKFEKSGYLDELQQYRLWIQFEEWYRDTHIHHPITTFTWYKKMPFFAQKGVFEHFLNSLGYIVEQTYFNDIPHWSIWSMKTAYIVYKQPVKEALITFFRRHLTTNENTNSISFSCHGHLGI